AFHIRKPLEQTLKVAVAELCADLRSAEHRRVPDDRVYLPPLREERVSADDVLIEVVQRGRRVDVELPLRGGAGRFLATLLEGGLLGDVQCDLGERDGEGVRVDSEEAQRGDAAAPSVPLRRRELPEHAREELGL